MRQSLAFGLGAALAIVATHGMVSSGLNLSGPLPSWTYRGFFQNTLLETWRLWSHAHGWEGPGDFVVNHLNHVDDFGRFYARVVIFLCPLLGFLAFSLVSRSHITRHWWKPLAVAIAFSTPLQQAIHYPLRSFGLNEPVAQAARAGVVFVLMVGSIGAVRTPTWLRPSQSQQSVSA